MIRQQMQRWQMDEKGLDEYLASIKKTPEQLREEYARALFAASNSPGYTEIARGKI